MENKYLKYYNSYLNKILENILLSTKENSLIINLKLSDNECRCVIELIEQNGEKKELNNMIFANNEVFRNEFLNKLIVEYQNRIKVVVKDVVDVDGDSNYTYRMVSEYNDLFIVDGITKKYAEELKSLNCCPDNTVVSNNSEDGYSTAISFLLLLAIMSMVILTYIYLK